MTPAEYGDEHELNEIIESFYAAEIATIEAEISRSDAPRLGPAHCSDCDSTFGGGAGIGQIVGGWVFDWFAHGQGVPEPVPGADEGVTTARARPRSWSARCWRWCSRIISRRVPRRKRQRLIGGYPEGTFTPLYDGYPQAEPAPLGPVPGLARRGVPGSAEARRQRATPPSGVTPRIKLGGRQNSLRFSRSSSEEIPSPDSTRRTSTEPVPLDVQEVRLARPPGQRLVSRRTAAAEFLVDGLWGHAVTA